MPFSLKRLRAHLRAEGVGQVVVKKRGSAIDVDDLRRALRLDRKADGRRTIVLTRLGSDPIALVCSNQLALSLGVERRDKVPVVDEWRPSKQRLFAGDRVIWCACQSGPRNAAKRVGSLPARDQQQAISAFAVRAKDFTAFEAVGRT